MKVLFVSTLYYPNVVGGAEITVRLLAEGAVRMGDEAVVVTLAPDGCRQERVVEGVRVHYLPLFNVFFPHGPSRRPAWLKPMWYTIEAFNPMMAWRLGAVVDREMPDLVNVHNLQGFSCAIWPVLARRGLPVVQTLHDHYSVCINSVMYRRGRNCTGRCARCHVLCAPRIRLSRRVHVVTAVSRKLWERVNGFGAYAGVWDARVVRGCNLDPPITGSRPARGAHGPLVLGFLGRLDPIKGLEVLLEAAGRIGSDQVQVRVGGTGAPGYEAALKARFAGPGVEFLGRVAPARFLAGVDALVVPSLCEEALGRVVHEAVGLGVPVIGAAIGGIPEIIREGVTGFLVPPGDSAALERLVRRLLDAPPDWTAMSAACALEGERFTFERIFAAYRSAWTAAIAICRTTGRPDRRGAKCDKVCVFDPPIASSNLGERSSCGEATRRRKG